MYKSILLTLFAATTISADSWNAPELFRRQTGTCSNQGQKACGTGCIDLTATCCPSGAGGCPLGKYCSLGSNGQYGCCTNGRICTGDGGVSTRSGNIIVSTPVVPVPGPESTQFIPDPVPVSTSTRRAVSTPGSIRSVVPSAISSVLQPDDSDTPTAESTDLPPPVIRPSTRSPAGTTSSLNAATALPPPGGAANSIHGDFSLLGLCAAVLPFFLV